LPGQPHPAGSATDAGRHPAPSGGAYRPQSDIDRDRIVEHAFEMLEEVGMADAPNRHAELLIAARGRRRDDGRVLLPRPMVEAALGRAPSTVELPGFVEGRHASTTEGFTIDGYGAVLAAIRHAHRIYDLCY